MKYSTALNRINIFFVIFLAILCFFSFRCSPVSPDWGVPWDELAGTVWYILDGDSTALNEVRFYEDSVVWIKDNYARGAYAIWDSMQVQSREVHIGKVMRKDVQVSEIDAQALDGMYLATELQWKRYVQGRYDPCDWTPLYDYSTYQWWYIFSIGDSVLEMGDVPYYYTFSSKKQVNVVYPDGFVPHLCEEGVRIRRNTL